MQVRRSTLTCLVLAWCACSNQAQALDAKAGDEIRACGDKPFANPVPPPPGIYTDQSIALDYDRLVPLPDPFSAVDLQYTDTVYRNPARLEQVYYDSTSGNQRAAWLVCVAEAGARNSGRDNARKLASLGCQTLESCSFRWEDLPLSPTTASGARLLAEIGREFEAEATVMQIRQQLVADALTAFLGAKIAARLIRTGTATGGTAPGGMNSAPRPRPRSLGAAANSSGLNWSWNSRRTFGHTFTRHGQGTTSTKQLIGRARGTGKPQGQWIDNQQAAEFLRGRRPYLRGPTVVRLPPGVRGLIILPDGRTVSASKAMLVPLPSGGYKTAYPIP